MPKKTDKEERNAMQRFNQNYNQDQKRRDEIIFGSYEPEKYKPDLRYYQGLTVEKLETLVEEGFTTKTYKFGNAPTIRTFIKFMKQYEGYTAHGLVTDLSRDDYRVDVEGLEKASEPSSCEEKKAFLTTFKKADDKTVTGRTYCYFD